MKFYYENINYKEVPNGVDGLCRASDFDYHYGFNNPIFKLSNYKEIIWNFTPNNTELNNEFILNNLDYFKSVFLKIQNKPNIKLMFSCLYEGADIVKFLELLIDLKNEFKLDKNQIIVVTINFISKQYEDDIRIICKPFLLADISKKYKKILDIPDEKNGVGILSTYEYLKTPKDKFFLTYNKNVTRIHRLKFMLWLVKNNLINDTLYSLLIKNNKSDYSILTFLSNVEYTELKGLWGYFDEFEKLGLNILDWDYDKDNNSSIFSDVMNTTKHHYSKTLFNIVTETTCVDDSCSLTEKSFKSIFYGLPYIINGPKGQLQTLKKEGYFSFPEIFSEDYDSMPSTLAKITYIGESMNTLCYDPARIELIKTPEILEKLKFNQQHFWKKDHDKHIHDLLESAWNQ